MRLTPLAVAVVVLVAGCTGVLTEVRSTPATIPPAALNPAGYVHGNTTEVPLTYPVGVGPIERDVTVYVWVSGYSRTVERADGMAETAALLVVSSPNRRVEGQSVNPFVHLSNRALVGRLFDLVAEAGTAIGRNVTGVVDLRETGVREQTILGQSVGIVTYTAAVSVASVEPTTPTGPTTPTAAADAGAVETRTLLVHLTAVEHGDDVVFVLGIHGDEMDEAETMAGLMAAIEHEAGAAD